MGFTEILLILAIALILFGPEDLPDIARALGKIVFEIRKATSELTKDFQNSIDTPANVLNNAYKQTTSPRSVEKETHVTQREEGNSTINDEVLLTYEDETPKDPLAELPLDMVSYEEKGASR